MEAHGAPRDHCRIGSLEMYHAYDFNLSDDHCRIGSLESSASGHMSGQFDHCRIGSLEIEMRM